MPPARASVPAPMLATAGRPPIGTGWAVEMKWDGARTVALCDGERCRLHSRNGRDVSGIYPELTIALSALARGRPTVVDGEIVAPDPRTGAPSFPRLQSRIHVAKPTAALIRTTPVEFYAFDLLALDGAPTTGLPYLERRRRLVDLSMSGPLVRTPPHWIGTDTKILLDLARDHGLEGIVCKRTDSTYQPGRRSPAWIKTALRRNTEAVVAGWLPGTGPHRATFGSLVLGAHDDDGRLVHIGNLGTGFTTAGRRALWERLDELERPTYPFDVTPPAPVVRAARWAEPVLVGDVEYREFTGDSLRHPSWKGLRPDKEPDEILVPPLP